MVAQRPPSRRQTVVLALLLSRLGRSPELTRLLLLLLALGQLRTRPYTTLEPDTGPKSTRQSNTPKGKGSSIRRPRERFL